MLLALLLAVFALCLYGVRIRFSGFHDDFLAKYRTDAIKGVFILLIVLSHSLGYIRESGYTFSAFGDSCFETFFNMISQLVVVMFLFYSGFGVAESFKKKGTSYVQAFPKRRLLTTLLNFDVAVIAFIILSMSLGLSVSLKDGLLSLLAWESVGNSNWYIFVILSCYLFSYVVMRLPLQRQEYRLSLLFVLCVMTIVVLSKCKEFWWYDTILSYPLGFLFSTYKENFVALFKKYYWAGGGLLLSLFIVFYFCPNGSLHLPFNMVSMLFALLCVLLTMKVRISCPALQWCGNHLFPIYIYMRVPMMLIEHRHPNLISTQPVIFILISLLVTLAIAGLYKFWQIKLYSLS